MSASPLGYLRGAAPLFYEVLLDHPELAAGPPGEGWLVGDAHLENFGAFRSGEGKASGGDSVVFDVNDFDEALIGPFRWDVLRLLTSVILAGRELGSNGKQSVRLCAAILQGYGPAMSEGRSPPTMPPPVLRLLEKVERRTHQDLLDRRTERVGQGRRFIRGDRYQDLAPELVEPARAAFELYVDRMDPQRKLEREHFIVEDVAFRIAGTGSLGVLRLAVVTRGKGEPDSRWIFDMKAEGAPAAHVLVPGPEGPPAERVLRANLACLVAPPRMAGTSELGSESLFVRRLLPQEDKLDLTRLVAEDLPELARFLGGLLGLVHRRGATQIPSGWSDEDLAALTEQAIVLAGLHEAAYLALCLTT